MSRSPAGRTASRRMMGMDRRAAGNGRKRVAILGSTGSIGTQALDVIAQHSDRFEVVGLAAGRNAGLLREQAKRFAPGTVSLAVDDGPAGLLRVALESEPDIVLAATDGAVAFDAVFAAVDAGIDIAIANKELVVAAGELLFAHAARSGAQLLPVDSEHSAIFQCLVGEPRERIASVVLTASGGPFWTASADEIRNATPAQALRHPTWTMGAKNTIDSATLMNKGLEVIEASRFFGLRADQIEVVVHRASIAHAFVIFKDGSIKAQLAAPDMRLPIGYALAYPDRLPSAPDGVASRQALGLGGQASSLTFEPVDDARFPCLRLAYRALESGGTYPAVLSAANEEAGRAFLQEKICFTDIATLVAKTLDAHEGRAATFDGVAAADEWARDHVRTTILATAH